MTDYTYAVATDSEVCNLIRQRPGEKHWEIVASLEDEEVAFQLAEDANMAQRLRPQLEEGQELSRKPQRRPRSKSRKK